MKKPRACQSLSSRWKQKRKSCCCGLHAEFDSGSSGSSGSTSQQQRHDQQQRKQTKQSRLPLAHAAGAHSRRAGAASGLCAHGGRQTLKVEKGSAQQEEEEEDKVRWRTQSRCGVPLACC